MMFLEATKAHASASPMPKLHGDRQAFGTTRRAAFLNSASAKISNPILNFFQTMDSRWYVPTARQVHAVLINA